LNSNEDPPPSPPGDSSETPSPPPLEVPTTANTASNPVAECGIPEVLTGNVDRVEAPAKNIRCPNCRKSFSSRLNFCPKCGRSRKELDEYVEEKKLIASSQRETGSAWNRLHQMTVFYLVVLALNFVAAYLLPLGTAWGMLVADSTLIVVCATWMLSTPGLLAGKFKAGYKFYILPLLPFAAIVTYFVTVTNNAIMIWLLGLTDIHQRFRGLDSFYEAQISLVVLIISVCVVPGIFEEIFFRGLVQRTLEEMMSSREAWIVQAVVFAIAHLNPIGFFTYLTFMGLYLGWLRNRSGSLIPGMLVHFTHNLLVVLNDRYRWVEWP
jgi:uncharacterized protein